MRARFALCLVILVGCGGGHKAPQDAGDDAPSDAGSSDVTCEVLTGTAGTCAVTPGDTRFLIKGTVLTPDTVYHGGQVAVDATGTITCAGCNCAAGGETTLVCPDSTISPGLINTHDHITYTNDPPYTDTGERYDDRQQWRLGLDGHTKIPAPGGASADQVSWGELRFLMGGATSIVGSGGEDGLLRNLDKTLQDGLTQTPVKFDTFPLGDSSGTRELSNCNYGTQTTPGSLTSVDAYEPHTAEGIDSYAHNEFLCESSMMYDTTAPGLSYDLAVAKTAMIHAVGLTADDYALMGAAGTKLIWSPRSNITLYGDTARVTVATRLGVTIALGTDWLPSGSMNLLRELTCADSFNKTYLDNFFTDRQLWQMVTANAAAATATDDVLGAIAQGKVADLAIFNAHGKPAYRSIIEAQPADVVLVMRGGKPLYGDDAIVGALAQGCDQLDVCGTTKQVCLMSEIGKNLAALQTSVGATMYPAFSCDPAPPNEPSCTPTRPVSVAGSTVYTGAAAAGDMDGDGIPDAMDNCPTVFNPIRPLDNGVQPDADGDGIGDACDPCPRDPNTTTCKPYDPNDRDGDGVPDASDNCPDVYNPQQTDTDGDGKGDACDACPTVANPGAQNCPATIYAVKSGMVPQHEAVEVGNALVTGTGTNGFFVQVKETDTGYTGADNSGLFVFTGTGSTLLASAIVGTRVTIEGSVDTYQGEVELDGVTAVTSVTMTPETAPAPIAASYSDVATGGTRATTLEGVIVALGASAVSTVNPNGEFTVTDAGGPATLVVQNFLYQYPGAAVGQPFTALTGILAFRQSASKLEPRGATDVVAGPPVLSSFAPAQSYVREGTSGATFPTALTVTLTGPAQGDTAVAVMSDDPNVVVVGGGVTVANGTTSAQVQITANAQVANANLTAILGTGMLTAQVRALGATEQPTTVTLSPSTATVAPGGGKTFTVTLDIPAPPGGTVVTLGAVSGSVPASVTVAQDTLAQTFTYTAPTTGTSDTITATMGSSSSMAAITVGIDHLVINEIDYDMVGTDNAEFVELYNPTGNDVDLTGLAIILVNGANNQTYATIDLSTAGTLPNGGYLVVAGANVTVAPPAIKLDPGWTTDAIQNGSPDGIALIDTNGPRLLDALSYEGSITQAVIAGFPGPVSLVEGTALATTVADSNTTDGSLCREPNGTDTDNANSDWKFCTTKTPGTANP
ncbi:MAG TPA: thrombospondin type 3 repeat-containing protein [Kofleriaceae bacterium]|nr:thrombospondin type 3 repeat-containing protein [Kofleriaceae bacterium]